MKNRSSNDNAPQPSGSHLSHAAEAGTGLATADSGEIEAGFALAESLIRVLESMRSQTFIVMSFLSSGNPDQSVY